MFTEFASEVGRRVLRVSPIEGIAWGHANLIRSMPSGAVRGEWERVSLTQRQPDDEASSRLAEQASVSFRTHGAAMGCNQACRQPAGLIVLEFQKALLLVYWCWLNNRFDDRRRSLSFAFANSAAGAQASDRQHCDQYDQDFAHLSPLLTA